MAYPAPGHRSAEYGHDVVLHQEITEVLGTVSAGKSDHEGLLAIGYWTLAEQDAESGTPAE
jgi:hypothetical protein